MALLDRRLKLTFSLQTGSFEGGGNTVTLEGLRASARVAHAGGPSDGTLDLVVYGLSDSIMNKLSTLGMQINLVPKNSVIVSAGDTDSGTYSTVFLGYILAAYADFKSAPDPGFHITAHTGLPQSVIPAEASSFRGPADVATIMQSLATKMGLKFENSGVQTKLPSSYFSGSYKNQMRNCAKAASCNATIINGVLAIWPKNGSRGGQVPLIAPPPKGSMIGYPTYTAYGLMLENIYDPSIGFGQKIQVESSLKPACGEWAIYGLDHLLEAITPGGKWQSTILAYNPKFTTPVK